MTNIDEARKRLEWLAGESDDQTAEDIHAVLDSLHAAVRERDSAKAYKGVLQKLLNRARREHMTPGNYLP